ncbi:uncharacterized protein LOC126371096 [Pectinophora gossypiella]|uniref:uncharacterized protein LOC126371096 n=1 Tax=Pectinophora gossypiella TaxID=13191 RepID=UPI00214EF94E|nr:uncharacterized protein LOC126371096 [Pectinophora gossypiella]
MVKCIRCGDEVQDYAKCSSCMNFYDFPCAGITEKGYRKLGADRQAAWRCPHCKTGTATGETSAQPQDITSAASGFAPPSCGSPKPATLEHVMEELNKIKLTLAPLLAVMEGIKEIKSEILEVKSSVTAVSNKLQNLDARLQVVERAQDDALKLEQRISQLESDLNEKNQWARLNNVEIKGVPMKDRENLFNVVTAIGSKIMYPITKQSINFVTRVPSKDNHSKPIILSFINRYVKEDFIAAARSTKKLYPTDIGLEGTNQIFVNDHLTVQNKILFTEAKKLAKAKDYDFIWVKNSKIFARKSPESKVITIKNSKDLDKIH